MAVNQYFFGCCCNRQPEHLNHTGEALLLALQNLLPLINALIEKDQLMADNLEKLTASVAKNTSVVGSAITLIQGFKAQLDAAGTDPAKLAALSSSLDDSDTALAAAVAANTPGAPPVPDTPALA